MVCGFWLDAWEIRPGDNIPAKIEEGLECSSVLLLCMSANAFGSDWAALESQTFRFRDPLNKDRRFVPVRLDDAPIRGSLAQFLYIDWRSERREVAYASLVAACRTHEMTSIAEAKAAGKQLIEKHPDELWGTENLKHRCIPMVGAVAVGKTVYACALAHEPTVKLARRDLILEVDHENSSIFHTYEWLERGEWAPRTAIGHGSKAVFTLRRKKMFRYECYQLSLLDASGEEWVSNLDIEGTRPDVLKKITLCDGLAIFMEVLITRDPTAHLEGHAQAHDPLYANIVLQLGSGAPTGRFPKHVAFILTKCDLYPELLMKPEAARQGLCEMYPLTYSQALKSLTNFDVFACSAVGALTKDGKPSGLRPIGIWEPILWLAENV
jgi:hypothetical protein